MKFPELRQDHLCVFVQSQKIDLHIIINFFRVDLDHGVPQDFKYQCDIFFEKALDFHAVGFSVDINETVVKQVIDHLLI